MTRRRIWSGVAALAVGVTALGYVNAAAPLAAPVYTKVIDADIAALNKLLNEGKPERGAMSTIKPLALLIASNAKHAGKDGVAAAAVKVAEAASKKDWAGATATAKTLASASGGTVPADLHKLYKMDLADAMSPFRLAKSGGLNIEKDIREGKKATSSITPDTAVLIGARTAAIAEFTYHFPVDKAASGAGAAKWKKLTDSMLDVSKQLTEAASKPGATPASLSKLMGALDATCINCHNEFRD